MRCTAEFPEISRITKPTFPPEGHLKYISGDRESVANVQDELD